MSHKIWVIIYGPNSTEFRKIVKFVTCPRKNKNKWPRFYRCFSNIVQLLNFESKMQWTWYESCFPTWRLYYSRVSTRIWRYGCCMVSFYSYCAMPSHDVSHIIEILLKSLLVKLTTYAIQSSLRNVQIVTAVIQILVIIFWWDANI